MSETRHTPGPWRVEPRQNVYAIMPQSKEAVTSLAKHFVFQGKPCGSIEAQDKTEEEISANADRIVACVNACEGLADPGAVPELVRLCEHVLARLDLEAKERPGELFPCNGLRDDIRAALARAKGE